MCDGLLLCGAMWVRHTAATASNTRFAWLAVLMMSLFTIVWVVVSMSAIGRFLTAPPYPLRTSNKIGRGMYKKSWMNDASQQREGEGCRVARSCVYCSARAWRGRPQRIERIMRQ